VRRAVRVASDNSAEQLCRGTESAWRVLAQRAACWPAVWMIPGLRSEKGRQATRR
jgi:hypothetical protein